MKGKSTSLDKVTVVIRSIGERTELLCRKLILEQGVSDSAVFFVRASPFSKAMLKSFVTGIEQKRPWTLCVDADLLMNSNSIQRLLDVAEREPLNVCAIQGYVLDKFFGGVRTAGNHLYRTSMLEKVINLIPHEGIDIRPETFALNKMNANGFPWVLVPEVVGLHDFEQSYDDIFRKCFIHSHKHIDFSNLFIHFWRNKARYDFDYRVALAGFAAGLEFFGEVRVDSRAKFLEPGLKRLDSLKKDDLCSESWCLDAVDEIIFSWKTPLKYWSFFPGGMVRSTDNLFTRIFISLKNQIKERGLLLGFLFFLCLGLKRIHDWLIQRCDWESA